MERKINRRVEEQSVCEIKRETERETYRKRRQFLAMKWKWKIAQRVDYGHYYFYHIVKDILENGY